MSEGEWLGLIIIPIGVAALGSLIVWLWCNAVPDDDGPEAGPLDCANLDSEND